MAVDRMQLWYAHLLHLLFTFTLEDMLVITSKSSSYPRGDAESSLPSCLKGLFMTQTPRAFVDRLLIHFRESEGREAVRLGEWPSFLRRLFPSSPSVHNLCDSKTCATRTLLKADARYGHLWRLLFMAVLVVFASAWRIMSPTNESTVRRWANFEGCKLLLGLTGYEATWCADLGCIPSATCHSLGTDTAPPSPCYVRMLQQSIVGHERSHSRVSGSENPTRRCF